MLFLAGTRDDRFVRRRARVHFDFDSAGRSCPSSAVGFAAQIVDGALGMAFGVISNTLLISLGVAPAAASAGVHTVETFTTCVCGISHIAHRNVDWKLLAPARPFPA